MKPRGASGDKTGDPLGVDYLIAAYLAATGVVAAASLSATGLALGAAHWLAAAAFLAAGRRGVPAAPVPRFFRITYPLALTPLLYLELATLNQLHGAGYFDAAVQGWEAALFGSQLSVVAAERWPSLWLSEGLHLGYLSYYLLIPGACLAAWAVRGSRALERVAFTTALGFFACYLCFSVFPVAGPRYAFSALSGPPSEGFFFQLVHRILEGGSSKGTAFPSSHVAATLSAWFAAGRETRRVFWIMAPFAVSLTVGTVYGRFHYAVDAAAGIVIAGIAYLVTPWLLERLESGRSRI